MEPPRIRPLAGELRRWLGADALRVEAARTELILGAGTGGDLALAWRARTTAGRKHRIRVHHIIASVKIILYPRAVLSTPGTSGYRLSYKLVLRAVPPTPLRWGIVYPRP